MGFPTWVDIASSVLVQPCLRCLGGARRYHGSRRERRVLRGGVIWSLGMT